MRILVIGIATFRRPDLLRVLIESLQGQLRFPEAPRTVVVVADNDQKESARATAESFDRTLVEYRVVTERGIPRVRNVLIDRARELGASFLLFLDDDTYALPGLVEHLLRTQRETGADLVQGATRPAFPAGTPEWIPRSGVFDRREYPTGTLIPMATTSNLLLRLESLRTLRFDESLELYGGSDTHFTLLCRHHGLTIAFARESVAIEPYPPDRLTVRWIVRRAYRVGVTRSRVRCMIDPGLFVRLYFIAEGIARMVLLVAVAPILPLVPKHLALRWVRFLAKGPGIVRGVFGLSFREYAAS